ncbi:basic helix-loop-helix transcription factor scleraxis [Aricia agestis]|uniref:basic helix-loop-helix transcription factor scleraxis n=1 Tax=Aricia agestis TaxID=91739 RepID=UPI001C2027C4|nr:basic helix-loop-helix transcription factor scleraxis [Aricia agestis]
MPRKRRTPERREELEDDDFLFDDSQSSSSRSGQEPVHRNAANARERARMRVLSKAFCRLKTTLPWVPADTKLSKLDTLRLAASYIAHLRALLHEPRSQHTPHPLSLAWPFAFQHGGIRTPQRWSPNSQNEANSTQNRQANDYSQDYENDYEEKNYDERNYEEINENQCQMQYSYGYKESYYEMRNSYNDGLINNV